MRGAGNCTFILKTLRACFSLFVCFWWFTILLEICPLWGCDEREVIASSSQLLPWQIGVSGRDCQCWSHVMWEIKKLCQFKLYSWKRKEQFKNSSYERFSYERGSIFIFYSFLFQTPEFRWIGGNYRKDDLT